MTVRIRLSRGGRKKVPFYKVIVADSRKARDGGFIERLGTYEPLLAKDNPNRFKIDIAKTEKWLADGATPSETVAKFLTQLKVKGADKYKPVFIPKAKKEVAKPAEVAQSEVAAENSETNPEAAEAAAE